MIRSSKHTLKYSNKGKREKINNFISEYRSLLGCVIDDVWENGIVDFSISDDKLNCPSFLSNDHLKQFDSDFSARMKQCVGKQACSMMRSAVAKRKKLLWWLSVAEDNETKEYIEKTLVLELATKPKTENTIPELDSRFIDVQKGNHFDLFVRIKQIGNKQTFNIPIKLTKSANKWLGQGDLKAGIRLSNKEITLIYDIPDKEKKGGRVVGADQGILTTLTLSDGQATRADKHGHTLSNIQEKLARKKKGSKAFRRAQDHRKNYINWSINQLNFSNIREVRLEKVKDIRKGKRVNKTLRHWTYPLIKSKIKALCEEVGCQFKEVDNVFRSQRCSKCGWVRKANRKGKRFLCNLCLFSGDSDYNAAVNLELDLVDVPYWLRVQKINLQGFYWMSGGFFDVRHQPIVGDTKRVEE